MKKTSKHISLLMLCVVFVGVLMPIRVKAQFSHLTVNNGLNGQSVTCLMKDSHGLMWVGTDFGVSCLLGTKCMNVKAEDGKNHSIANIVEMPDGRIIVQESDGGLFCVCLETLVAQRICTEVNDANDVCELDGLLYVKTSSGMIACNADGTTTVMNRFDDKGKVWKRVELLMKSRHKTADPTAGPLGVNNSVHVIMNDKQLGIKWYGHFIDGLVHTFPNRRVFEAYRFGDFDTSALPVRSFCIHGDDIMIGTRRGLYHVNEKRNKVEYHNPEDFGASIITNIKWFAGRFIYATFDGGVIPMRREGSFSALAVSPDSTRLYACGSDGVYVYDQQLNEVAHFDHTNSSLPDVYMPDIYVDGIGKVWISSLQGMSIFDPVSGTVQSASFPPGFFNQERDLAFSDAGNGEMWAYTLSCIYRCKENLSEFRKVETMLTGIEFVQNIGRGQVLVGTNNGAFLCDTTLAVICHFGMESGLPSMLFNKKEVQRTSDGTLWMANGRGLVRMTRGLLSHMADSINAKCVVAALSIDGKLIGDDYILNLTRTHRINLSWNVLSEKAELTPLLLDYSEGGNRYYEWSLDGGEWQLTTDMDRIALGNLALGCHRIAVRLCGHPETVDEWQVVVTPSLLFLFEIVFVLLLGSIVVIIVKTRRIRMAMRSKLHEKHALERDIIAQRTEERLRREAEQEREAEAERNRQAMVERLSPKESKELIRKAKEYMETERPYRKQSFRLSELASAIGSTPTTMSILFNQQMQTTFFDFVNAYRMEDFKCMANDSKYANYTIMALSEMCGFKKSSFFATFKKFEGCTPKEWLTVHHKPVDNE